MLVWAAYHDGIGNWEALRFELGDKLGSEGIKVSLSNAFSV